MKSSKLTFHVSLQTGEMEVRNPMFEDDATPKANGQKLAD